MTTIFTIGYGGRTPTEFCELLTSAGVGCIVDVRADPYHAFMPYYALNKKNPDTQGIVDLLARSGIAYRWVQELGNPWRADAGWQENYRQRLEAEGRERTAALFASDLPSPRCLLCSEKRCQKKGVTDCHRLLVTEYLHRLDPELEIVHL